jgi:hypothetical protein
MTLIGLIEGTKNYIFMRSPNNVIFTAIQALFDETLFPKCPNMHCLGYTPVGLTPGDLQGEHNGPLDNENENYGGGLPPLPPNPYHPMVSQGPPAARQQPPPPLPVSSGRGSPLQSLYRDDDDALSYKTKSPSPLVLELTPPVGEYRPITPQRPIRNHQHPLGWRPVTTTCQDNLDNPDSLKWVPEHHTPKSFLDEHKKVLENCLGNFPIDYERLPAFWSPSPSPPTPPRPLPVVPLQAPANMNPPLRHLGRIRHLSSDLTMFTEISLL